MKLKQLTLKQSLNKAYRLIKPERASIEQFKANFKLLLGHINPQESEENLKGHVMDFLKNTWYSPAYHIATKGRTDFVIHNSKDASHTTGVLFEAKKPSNNEMVTTADLNRKAMHEIVLYYLRERIEHHNGDIRHIVITSIYEWFVFDVQEFERLFFKNAGLVKDYKAWMAKQKVSPNNDFFYNDIAKPFLAALDEEIEFTYFDIREFEKPLRNSDKDNDNKLIPLFKVLSPTHLLKLPFANDSNSLDRGFYTELLYIIGIEEVNEGNKKIIRRRAECKRNDGSLIENTIVQLDTENCLHKVTDRSSYGDTNDEQMFSVASELCITWVNRILFLKLLEAQLLKYHKGNPAYKFLNYTTLPQYDELYKLFFMVLAKKQPERTEKVRARYSHIPYLNSSLFDRTPLEEQTIRINMLDDEADLPLPDRTVLRDDRNKPIAPKLNTLQYLFEFLNAYDFASEGTEEIQEERKTLINASVLGLIFEKINGYKDGSIFTPGFITMYMCRQSIRQAVVNKFKEKYNWKAYTFDDLQNYISDDRSAKRIIDHNALINTLTICDPAVGSGHFLVSALNELIAIKSELGILADKNGKRLSDHLAIVENDELLIIDKERNFFTYSVATAHDHITIPNAEVQRVQETLFHEKQTLIENCLFGVDINPKSVQICRLRLWIELLKNAYYIAEGGKSNGELQTLPNIDINIKTGNSLISRFGLDEDLRSATRILRRRYQSTKTE
ncbi:MAG: type restriction endonuclease [Segetibacter sp.]|nr:type restriction endonuclease [Segetibacter sp.]